MKTRYRVSGRKAEARCRRPLLRGRGRVAAPRAISAPSLPCSQQREVVHIIPVVRDCPSRGLRKICGVCRICSRKVLDIRPHFVTARPASAEASAVTLLWRDEPARQAAGYLGYLKHLFDMKRRPWTNQFKGSEFKVRGEGTRLRSLYSHGGTILRGGKVMKFRGIYKPGRNL